MKLTKDTLIAFMTVVALAGAALGLANKTEAMINTEAMAKLGIHRMPNGGWMQETQAAQAAEASAGAQDTGHGLRGDGNGLLEPSLRRRSERGRHE